MMFFALLERTAIKSVQSNIGLLTRKRAESDSYISSMLVQKNVIKFRKLYNEERGILTRKIPNTPVHYYVCVRFLTSGFCICG